MNSLTTHGYITSAMYLDPSWKFPVIILLSIIALVGVVLTIGGIASNNSLMTAIRLTMVAIPALIAGSLALGTTTGFLAHNTEFIRNLNTVKRN